VRLAELVPPVVLDVGGPGAALDMQELTRRGVFELDSSQRRQIVILHKIFAFFIQAEFFFGKHSTF